VRPIGTLTPSKGLDLNWLIQLGDASREGGLTRGRAQKSSDHGIANRPDHRSAQGREPCHSVGRRDHSPSRSSASALVLHEVFVGAAARKDVGEQLGRRDGILNPEVHPLTARGTVHMGRITREEGVPVPIPLCKPMRHAEV
jgi:hypothetical protein